MASFATASSASSSKKRSTSVHYDKSKGLWQPRKSSGPSSSRQTPDDAGFEVARGVGVAAKAKDPATSRIVRHLVVDAAVDRPGSADRVAEGVVFKMFLHLSIPPSVLPTPTVPAVTFTLLAARTTERTHLLSSSIHPYPSPSGPREYASAVTALGLGGPRDWPKRHRPRSSSVGSALTASVLSTTSSATLAQASAGQLDATIVERGEGICLDLSKTPTAFEDVDGRGSASFVVVLEMSTGWTFRGPGWPLAAAVPTPPCLRNTLRLSLPPATDLCPHRDCSQEEDDGRSSYTTYPRLRERRTPAASYFAQSPHPRPRPTISRPSAARTRTESNASEEERALAEESEPEVAIDPALDSSPASSADGDIEDESRTVEGVFPSTDRLWVIFASGRSTAKPAPAFKGRARVTATVVDDAVSLEIWLLATFRDVPFASLAEPIELTFSTSFGSDDDGDDYAPLSMEWTLAEPDQEGKGIVGVSLPRVSPDLKSSPRGVGARPGLDSSPSKQSTASLASDSDLLRTKAPFPAEPWAVKGEEDEGEASFESSFRSSNATSILATPSPGIAHVPAFDPTPNANEFKVWLDAGRFIDSADPEAVDVPAGFSVDFVGRAVVPVEFDDGRAFRLPMFGFQTTDLSLSGLDVAEGSVSCPDPLLHGILPVPLPRDEGEADRVEICLVGGGPAPGRRLVAQLERPAPPLLPTAPSSGAELDRLAGSVPGSVRPRPLDDPIASASIGLTVRRRSHGRAVQRLEIAMRATSATVAKGFGLRWTLERHQRLVPKLLFVGGDRLDVSDRAGGASDVVLVAVPPKTLAPPFPNGLVEVKMSVEVVSYGVPEGPGQGRPVECKLPSFPAVVGVLDVEVTGGRILSSAGADVLSAERARGFDVGPDRPILVVVGGGGVPSLRDRSRRPLDLPVAILVLLLLLLVGLGVVLVRQQSLIDRLASDLSALQRSFSLTELPSQVDPTTPLPSPSPPPPPPSPLPLPAGGRRAATDLAMTLDPIGSFLLLPIRALVRALHAVLASLSARS